MAASVWLSKLVHNLSWNFKLDVVHTRSELKHLLTLLSELLLDSVSETWESNIKVFVRHTLCKTLLSNDLVFLQQPLGPDEVSDPSGKFLF